MSCNFTAFPAVFLSCQVDGRVIMKGCVQWNSIYNWKDFCLGESNSALLDELAST